MRSSYDANGVRIVSAWLCVTELKWESVLSILLVLRMSGTASGCQRTARINTSRL